MMRRERNRDRRRRRQRVAAGHTDPYFHGVARDLRGRGDGPGDPPGGGGRRPGLSSTSRRGAPRRRARPRSRTQAFAETDVRSTCSCRSTTWATGSRAKFVCRRRPADHRPVWTGPRQDDLSRADHCPFDFHDQKGSARNAGSQQAGVEDRVDLLHDGGVIGDGSRASAGSTSPPHRPGCRDVPAQGSVSVGADADLVITTGRDGRSAPGPTGGRLLVHEGRTVRAGPTWSCRAAR
jgi:hypothetical protein